MRAVCFARWACVVSVALLAACGAVEPQASVPASEPPAVSAAPTLAPTAEASSATKPAALSPNPPARAVPPLSPPPVVTTPIAGEPSGAALAEARLVPSNCAALKAGAQRSANARIREMRQALADEFQSWAREQPDCWARPKTGDGLGSIGSGSGTGTGQGYGSGSGRLGGAHSTSAPRMAQSASGTNNQVAHVDEADIVKSDGRYVYVAMNGALRILEALEPKIISVTRLRGEVKELFVAGDRAVVYASEGGTGRPACTYGYDCAFLGDGSATRILVLDIANRAAPRLVRSIELSGSLIAARRIGQAVHTVVGEGDTGKPSTRLGPTASSAAVSKKRT